MPATMVIRKPLVEHNAPAPSLKKRAIDKALIAKTNHHASTSRSTAKKTKKAPSHEEILIRNWLSLPQSQFGIHYNLGSTKCYASLPTVQDGISILQMVANKCPFELKMQELKSIIFTKYPTGAGLVYIREIFEAGDPEYGPPWQLGLAVDVRTISQPQMTRLRIMIVDERRRDVMLSYLRFYETTPFDSACSVFDHFESFKKKYGKLRDHRVKFDRLFCFTFALRKFDCWMYRMERGWSRSRMVEGLATRWKNLLSTRTLEELGLDEEFSYPAVRALLQSFQDKVESAPTFGDPRMIFKYEWKTS